MQWEDYYDYGDDDNDEFEDNANNNDDYDAPHPQMVTTMMKKLVHLLRPCSWGTLDEATLQHGSPTVHNLYVLPMMMIILKSCQ